MSLLADPDALVEPAFWHCPEYHVTLGPEAVDLAKLFGRTPNPEQALLLEGSLGMDRRGRLTAFEVFVVASRQNLKTGFFEFRGLAKALLLRRPVQIWTAHKESATDQALLDFKQMIDSSAELSRRVKRITEGKGDKSIEFVNNCVIVFRPRTGKAGQSMSADDVDLDEYFAVEPKHLGSLVPTLSTRPRAQVGGASSAPHAGSKSQRSLMARGRAAAEGRAVEPRLLYAEWSVQRFLGKNLDGTPRYGPPPCQDKDCEHKVGAEGCIADDRELIKLANPSAGRSAAPSISWEYLADERRTLSADKDGLVEYFRERLGAGDEGNAADALTIFGPAAVWLAGTKVEVPRPEVPAAIGIGVSHDRSWASIAAASPVNVEEVPGDEDSPVVAYTHVAPADRREGTAWLVDEVKRIQDEHDCLVVMDEKSPGRNLIRRLQDAGVRLTTLTFDEYVQATSDFDDHVSGQVLLHPAEAPELDDAVAGAAWRYVGEQRVVGHRQSTEDISMLEAAICAAHGAEQQRESIYEERGLHVW